MTDTLTHTEDCTEYGLTCAECQAHSCTERLDGAEDFRYCNVTQEELCAACYESELEHLSTVILFDPNESEPVKYLVGDRISMDQFGDDAPSGFERVYHRTDAWRGYYETRVPGTIEIESGADLYGTSTTVRDLAERIREDHEQGILPVPVYVVIDLTSNVFATAMGIRIRQADQITFKRWIQNEEEN